MQNPQLHVIRVWNNEEKQQRKMKEEGREGTEQNLREGKNKITDWTVRIGERERESVCAFEVGFEDVSVKSESALV